MGNRANLVIVEDGDWSPTIAAANRLTVTHYDSDFDTAATVLDFEHRWVAQPGTL